MNRFWTSRIRLPRRRFKWRSVMEVIEMITASLAVIFTNATSKSIVLGGVIALAGASLFTWAGGFQRMERDGVLTLAGPYRFVRHPWILSRFMMVFGVILMARLPWLFLLAMIGLAPMYRRMTREEDQWLQAQLGAMAAEYRAFVAGFIPQFVPARLPAAGRLTPQDEFSWRRALWRRPGRGAFAMIGVTVTIIGMTIWVGHWTPVWLWRSVAVVASGVGIFWLSRDRARWLESR